MWLLVVGLTACSYQAPISGTPGDGAADALADVNTPDTPTIAWLHPYQHRKRITLRETQIDDTGGALTNFPVLISLDDPDLANATATTDMAFTTADAVTLLDSEIESYSAGKLVAWVRIPDLSATQDTPIFVYYGNPAPVPTNPASVWAGEFLGVWHLSQDPGPAGTGDLKDSTSPANNGTATTNMDPQDLVPAQVGNGLRFDGASDFIDFPAAIDVGNDFTIALWANLDATSTAGVKTVFANSAQGANTDGYRMFVNTSGQTNRRVVFETGNGSSGSSCASPDNAVVAGDWAYLVAVVDRNNGSGKIFVNGVDVTNTAGVRTDFATNSNFEIARMEGSLLFFGVIDEVSVATVQRPLGWIRTTYNNQVAPGTFHTVEVEEDEP